MAGKTYGIREMKAIVEYLTKTSFMVKSRAGRCGWNMLIQSSPTELGRV